MTNGEIFSVISSVIQGSQAHADLLGICYEAKRLQCSIRNYLAEYGERDMETELLGPLQAQLSPEQSEGYLERLQAEINDWDCGAFNDVSGFDWTLNNFVGVLESQMYVDAGDAVLVLYSEPDEFA